MSIEEKICEIHDIVVGIKADMRAEKIICESKHHGVDGRLDGLHLVIKGNGQPGLERKHQDLSEAFIGMRATVFAYSTVGSIVGGGIMTIVMAILVKHFTKG